MRKIIYTRPDGGVCVVTPAPEMFDKNSRTRQLLASHGRLVGNVSPDVILGLIVAKDVPANATDVQIVDEAEIPEDRTFRNALKANGGGVEVDMPAAREIHREKLRAFRKPMLEALDVEYQRADERSDAAEKQRIAALKQGLRDVTDAPEIESASTPEALKAVLPEALR